MFQGDAQTEWCMFEDGACFRVMFKQGFRVMFQGDVQTGWCMFQGDVQTGWCMFQGDVHTGWYMFQGGACFKVVHVSV